MPRSHTRRAMLFLCRCSVLLTLLTAFLLVAPLAGAGAVGPVVDDLPNSPPSSFSLSLSPSPPASAEGYGSREALLQSVTGVDSLPTEDGYSLGHTVPITCLDRNVETGEHITDKNGLLQYSPFWTCNETGLPLQLRYGIDEEVACTIDFISDPFFHLLEYYLHNDVPLTCRVPFIPISDNRPSHPPVLGVKTAEDAAKHDSKGGKDFVEVISPDLGFGLDNPLYTPLVLSLTGLVQLSHIHLSTRVNIIFHTDAHNSGTEEERVNADGKLDSGTTTTITASRGEAYPESPHSAVLQGAHISSGTGYSSSLNSGSKFIIGDPLTLHFSVHWYGPSLPSSAACLLAKHSSKSRLGISFVRPSTFGSLMTNILSMILGAVMMAVWISYRLSTGKPTFFRRGFSAGKLLAESKRSLFFGKGSGTGSILPMSDSDTHHPLASSSASEVASGAGAPNWRPGAGATSGRASVPEAGTGYNISSLTNSVASQYSSAVGKKD